MTKMCHTSWKPNTAGFEVEEPGGVNHGAQGEHHPAHSPAEQGEGRQNAQNLLDRKDTQPAHDHVYHRVEPARAFDDDHFGNHTGESNGQTASNSPQR